MAKPRVTATDRLSNVIEVVELGQRTGLLTVERGSGSVQEEGEIYFVSGRAVYASLAGLRGREALAGLSRWGSCRFAFDKDAPRLSSNLAPIPGAMRGDRKSTRLNSSHPSISYAVFCLKKKNKHHSTIILDCESFAVLILHALC